MNIFNPLISGSLSVSGSGEISGDLTVLGTINATVSGTTSNAISASHAAEYLLTSSFESFTGSYTTGSFTGSFDGDGSKLTNIPASGVTGLNLTQIADGTATASISQENGLKVNTNTEITGALTISGSISLNGVPVGTGKLDETVFNSYSSSNNITNSLQNERLDSLETLSGSFTGSFSGSFNGDGINLFNIPASGVTGLNLTQIADGSVTASVSNTNGLRVNGKSEITGSLIVTNGITGSIDYNNLTNVPTLVSGNLQIEITGTTGYSTFSSSISTSIGSLSSSVATTTSGLSSSIGSLSSSVSTSIGSLSSSVAITTSGLSSSIGFLSSSFNETDEDKEGRISVIESHYATTGSNVFKGDQTITGSLYISQNLIVQGSSSLENITASAVSIGTNTIILNSDTPAIRYAGISVFDSGSTNVTASLFYDSLTNNWKFQHSDVGTNDASILLYGPLGTGIDNAPTLDGNFLTKVENNGHGHHLTTSSIFDNGTKVSINSNSEITGSLTVTGVIRSTTTPLVSGSDQINHNTTTNYVANQHIDHTTVSISPGSGLTGGGTIAATRTLSIDTGGVTNAMLAGSIENGKLSNSSLTIGTTAISLGSSSTTLGGLTSVTSTAFTGSLQGNISGNAATVTTNANLTGVVTSTGNVTTIANGNITNAMLAGSIENGKLSNSSFHVGTTSISLGRASASQTLTGVSIDGNATSETLSTVTARGNTTNGGINVNGNILLTGTATTTNQARTIDFTGFDKEATADFSDRAYIQHTTNTGGHAGSVLVISSENDADDGIAFLTNASSKLKHNSNNIATEAFVTSQGYITGVTNITGTAGSETLATVTSRGATTSTATIFTGTLYSRKAQTNGDYTTAALWTESHSNTTTGIAFHISGNQGKFLEMRTDGVLYWHGSTVWHSGNLTNLNQLANGPGYITSSDSISGNAGSVTNGVYTTGDQTIGGVKTFSTRINLHQSGAGGGQNIFTGVDSPTSANGRAQLILSSAYSDLVIASSQTNNQHGSTLSFAAYNPSNAAEYRKFVINQGNWGSRQHMLSFGYSNSSNTNPHNEINSGVNVITLDGINKRLGIRVEDPLYNLHVNGTGYVTDNLLIGTTTSGGRVTIRSTVANSTVLNIQGTSGQLFSVTDSLTGTIFAASDVSGIPILEVNSNGTVTVDNTLNVFGDVTAFFSSDERLKDNVTPISNAVEKIKLIGGYEFDWNGLSKNTGHDVGVIAQEVEKVLPEVVTTRDTGFKAVKYDRLTALLIQANKELIERVEYLESKLK
jgi:hypothetical protein